MYTGQTITGNGPVKYPKIQKLTKAKITHLSRIILIVLSSLANHKIPTRHQENQKAEHELVKYLQLFAEQENRNIIRNTYVGTSGHSQDSKRVQLNKDCQSRIRLVRKSFDRREPRNGMTKLGRLVCTQCTWTSAGSYLSTGELVCHQC